MTPIARATEATDRPPRRASTITALALASGGEETEAMHRSNASRSELEAERSKPPPPVVPSPFSRPWMQAFLNDAMNSADLPATSRKHGLTLVEVRQARNQDPAFGKAMLDVDATIRLSIVQTLEAKAATGDGRATSLLLRRQDQLSTLNGETVAGDLDPRVAEAMIAAGLETATKLGLKLTT